MSTHSLRRLPGWKLPQLALLGILIAGPALCAGCDMMHVVPPGERLHNSLVGVRTVVVAPFMNLSITPDVDLLAVTNAFASELQQVKGINVVPLGRVYQYLSANQMATVASPEEARGLAEAFQADATIVGAVTEYDAYAPRIGLAIQMYTASAVPVSPGQGGAAEFDPVAASQSAVPFAVTKNEADRPRDMISRVFSGLDVKTEDLAKTYATVRPADTSPFGWRRYIKDQREFQRLCSYGVIRQMMGLAGRDITAPRINVGPGAGKWPK